MRKYVLTCLLLLTVVAAMAQKKSVINLRSSEHIEGVKHNGVDVLKVYKGVFEQDNSTLRSDSAYFYQQQNAFDAFGHVVISQGDTLNIYSDKLNYNGNTKVAILTDHVRMVDKDATLTTNYLTYNTATRIGTYTGGGKLVNKDNTLTSKNGYYFAYSRDSYFRYDVRLLTVDALIKTDTLRYNSGSRIAYFYGPTDIYGKDKDTLYTENGLYNTITEQAFFGKKNLYKKGTKSLKGDSMFYDRKKGYGRAVKNITFNDNEQKMTLKGDLGTYTKADERAIATEHAYAIIVTEERDTTKNDSVSGKPLLKDQGNKKNGDTLKNVKKPAVDSKNKQPDKAVVSKVPDTAKNVTPLVMPVLQNINPKKTPTDSLKKKPAAKATAVAAPPGKDGVKDTTLAKGKIKRDSMFITADTLDTQILTFKDLKALQEKRRLANVRDTSSKAKRQSIVYTKVPKFLTIEPPAFPKDTSYFRSDFFGKSKPQNVPKPKIAQVDPKKPVNKPDSLKKSNQPDSVYLNKQVALSDTARIRVLSAYHHAKIFKSDLQAKSDSIFYSASDSTIRLFVHPIIWTQGSQLTGDTVNLQMKNKKLNNVELYPSAFIVNIEKNDSTHFNQVAGKKMRGFFKDDKLEKMFVDGNAESIFFSRDSDKISGMQRSLSSRIRINFKDGKAIKLALLAKPEQRYGPLEKFTEDDKVLKGFIWKPKERPVSKESIIHPVNTDVVVKKTTGKGTGTGKQPLNPPPGAKTGKDTTGVNPPGKVTQDLKTGKDTTASSTPSKLPAIKTGKDSTVIKPPATKTGKDSTGIKKPQPVIKTGKDTSKTN